MNNMETIIMYCDKIKVLMQSDEMTILDLARCAAFFKTIARLSQTTIDRLQEEINTELRNVGKKHEGG